MGFPNDWLNELMRKNDIVSVISEYVHLTPKGGRLWGHCPFHAERNPSFSVTPEKQLFHCFSCKAGGSVIQFIMQVESLSYIDTIRHLAQRVGMDMPEEIDDRTLIEQKHMRERLYEINREAAMFYHRYLFSPEGGAARTYLAKRGVDAKTATKFGLGYSPDSWDSLFLHLSSLGFSREDMIRAGLAVQGRNSRDKTFDFFRGRLMFPVISSMGKVIAFGGRTLGNDDPKYINTGDTPVYNKRENIYAINLLRGVKHGDIIMVEGYMDVISLHSRGITNAVASLGTALTSQQAKLLKRFAPRVYYAYDGDEAGQKAMLRGIDILDSAGVEPRVIVIPDDMDPDDYVRRFGPDSFLLLKDSSLTGVGFKIERIAKLRGLDTADGRELFAREACTLLSRLEPVERDRYIPVVSEMSGLSLETVREQCGVRPRITENSPVIIRNNTYKTPRSDSERIKCERMLMACLMRSTETADLIRSISGFTPLLFSDNSLKAFYYELRKAQQTGNCDITLMLASLEVSMAEEPAAAFTLSGDIDNPVACAKDLVIKLIRMDAESSILELVNRVKVETNPNVRKQLTLSIAELQKQLYSSKQ